MEDRMKHWIVAALLLAGLQARAFDLQGHRGARAGAREHLAGFRAGAGYRGSKPTSPSRAMASW
jgi:hypothetical protein